MTMWAANWLLCKWGSYDFHNNHKKHRNNGNCRKPIDPYEAASIYIHPNSFIYSLTYAWNNSSDLNSIMLHSNLLHKSTTLFPYQYLPGWIYSDLFWFILIYSKSKLTKFESIVTCSTFLQSRYSSLFSLHSITGHSNRNITYRKNRNHTYIYVYTHTDTQWVYIQCIKAT